MTLLTKDDKSRRAGAHAVSFYGEYAGFAVRVGRFLKEALDAGGRAIAICTDAHATAIEEQLAQEGVDVATALHTGAFTCLGAGEMLQRFMTEDGPDEAAFRSSVGQLVARAAASGGRLHLFGEMVAVLWEARQLNAALELERLWNVLGSEVPFSLLCGYPAADASDAPAVEEVCRLHDVVTNEPLLDWTAELRFDFPPTADSVRAARRRAAAELRRLGREELCEAAVVIVSELATNAVLHARSPFTLILSPQATGVRIAVRDGAPAPAVGEFDSAAATGRGLRLVKALAARTGMEPCGDGKVFFAELDT